MKPRPISYPPVIEGTEIDLTKGEKHDHPDIEPGKQYLCLIDSQWHFGQFSRQWYGLNFEGWKHNPCAGYQYDKPGFNCSRWQRVIEVKINE